MIRTAKQSVMCFYSIIKLRPIVYKTNNLIKYSSEVFNLKIQRSRINHLVGCTYIQPWLRRTNVDFDLYRQSNILNDINRRDCWKPYSDYFDLVLGS